MDCGESFIESLKAIVQIISSCALYSAVGEPHAVTIAACCATGLPGDCGTSQFASSLAAESLESPAASIDTSGGPCDGSGHDSDCASVDAARAASAASAACSVSAGEALLRLGSHSSAREVGDSSGSSSLVPPAAVSGASSAVAGTLAGSCFCSCSSSRGGDDASAETDEVFSDAAGVGAVAVEGAGVVDGEARLCTSAQAESNNKPSTPS